MFQDFGGSRIWANWDFVERLRCLLFCQSRPWYILLYFISFHFICKYWLLESPSGYEQSFVLFPEGWVMICIRKRQRQTSCAALPHHIRPCRRPEHRLLQTQEVLALCRPKGSNELFMFTGWRLTKCYSSSELKPWIHSFKNHSPLGRINLFSSFFFPKTIGSNRLILLTHMMCQCAVWSGSVSVHHFGVFEFMWVKITVNEFGFLREKSSLVLFSVLARQHQTAIVMWNILHWMLI